MKKSGIFIIPLLIFAVISILGNRLFASGNASPVVLVAISAAAMLGMALFRPKAAPAPTSDSVRSLLGDFAEDVFSRDPQLESAFRSAVSDYMKGMPKSAISKLEKLRNQCDNDQESYAVSVALGLAKSSMGDYEAAVKLYNKAVVLHPNAELATAIGSAQQRMGELKEAIDSYEFALDLEPENLGVRAQLATACVACGDFERAIDHAQQVLDLDENHASALATIAICHGVLGNESLYAGYTVKAVDAGYKEDKITATVPALKKKFKR